MLLSFLIYLNGILVFGLAAGAEGTNSCSVVEKEFIEGMKLSIGRTESWRGGVKGLDKKLFTWRFWIGIKVASGKLNGIDLGGVIEGWGKSSIGSGVLKNVKVSL